MWNIHSLTRVQKLELLGAGALIAVVLGLSLWYMATHQAPEPYSPLVEETVPVPPTEPQTIREHAQYYDIEAAYPSETPLSVSAGTTADVEAIDTMKSFVEDTIQQFKREGNFASLTKEDIQMMGYEDGRKQALAIEYNEVLAPHTVSYAYTLYTDTFGAHPNSFYRTFVFDAETGAELSLASLFKPRTDYLKRISEIARFELQKKLGEDADVSYMQQGTAPETANFQTFVVEGNTLVFLFPPYQVGPYALGPQSVSIPLAQLSEVLNEKYVP
ncbi:DUF3298 domain-containing protein [Patescibacteria group bacterium]|nr:DUF3298 domain-containing protein [Patescibacteria group bacterium]MBU1500573.1 DUF3298 domain-containing protein [Patescibacteria group bacterium]MBU2080458.1 DUF3298 domain-containing protein [Patescibacteria group bacterium]MBU2123737.1 DUF3298 domain-containing protein [Patescibacteria group bacterium]MBU2194593.1 DUF3298 domain-containing protein [Patescibacteria group bacterium]